MAPPGVNKKKVNYGKEKKKKVRVIKKRGKALEVSGPRTMSGAPAPFALRVRGFAPAPVVHVVSKVQLHDRSQQHWPWEHMSTRASVGRVSAAHALPPPQRRPDTLPPTTCACDLCSDTVRESSWLALPGIPNTHGRWRSAAQRWRCLSWSSARPRPRRAICKSWSRRRQTPRLQSGGEEGRARYSRSRSRRRRQQRRRVARRPMSCRNSWGGPLTHDPAAGADGPQHSSTFAFLMKTRMRECTFAWVCGLEAACLAPAHRHQQDKRFLAARMHACAAMRCVP